MDLKALKQAEADFLATYPGGFASPEMQAIGKKHKLEKMVEQAQEAFAKPAFAQPRAVTTAMTKLVSRSSMVSLFEKPKFRDYVMALDDAQTTALSDGFRELLHGDQAAGFEAMLEVLRPGKLAKWSLMTVLPNYYRPDEEVFVKPTTAKGVIAQFGLADLVYKPQPSWDFYRRYRAYILQMRKAVDPAIAPNNAAFCGFLMMSQKSA